MKTKKWIHVAVLLGMGAVQFARADAVVYQPKTANNNFHDAFMRNDNPNCTTCSGEWADFLMYYLGGGYLGDFAVQFDGLNAYIGGYEAVTSAVLSLTIYYPPVTDSNPSAMLDVYQLTQPWANGATWFSNGLGSAWTTAGGTIGATPVASVTPATNTYYTTLNWDVTQTVSNWVANVTPDNGFLVKWAPGSFDRIFYAFGSGLADVIPSFASYGWEPKLTIQTIPEPSAFLVIVMTATGAFITRRFVRR
jgi:hypothetical protein